MNDGQQPLTFSMSQEAEIEAAVRLRLSGLTEKTRAVLMQNPELKPLDPGVFGDFR